MKITIFLIFAGGIFFSCVHSGRVKRTSDTWPTEEQIREYVSSHTSENANNETQISDYDPNLSEGNAKYDEDDKDDPVDTHGYGEQKLSEKSKLKDDRQTQGSYYGNYNDYPFDMENYEEQFRKQHRHKKHGSPRDEVYHSSNLHSVELTRQAHTVILIDGLTEYEKEHLPVSVTYETNVTPKEWIKYHDFLFRKRASEILNDCHDLWRWQDPFTPEDIAHASISPYAHHKHLSIIVFVLDPYSFERNTFMTGKTIFKCFKRDLGKFQKLMEGNVTGVSIGLDEYEEHTTTIPEEKSDEYRFPTVSFIFCIMGAFCVISIAIHCRREGNCARLPKLPNFRIAGAPIPRPDPAEGGNSTSRQSLRSVLRRCFQSTRYNASRDCLIMNDINEIAETTV